MSILFTPDGLFPTVIALAGVLLFCFAPYLPSLFSPSWVRLIGFGVICTSLCPLWVLTGSWCIPSVLGLACLAIMVVAHLLQTRHHAEDITHEDQ